MNAEAILEVNNQLAQCKNLVTNENKSAFEWAKSFSIFYESAVEKATKSTGNINQWRDDIYALRDGWESKISQWNQISPDNIEIKDMAGDFMNILTNLIQLKDEPKFVAL